MREENQQRSAITPQNYTFQLTDYQKLGRNEFYVLEARPLTKNKFLFRGRIWVDAKDFAIAQVEGEPAVNPSWWTVKTDFTRSYQKIGSFWLPESNESETKVRIFGSRSPKYSSNATDSPAQSFAPYSSRTTTPPGTIKG